MDTYYSKDKKPSCNNNISEIIERIAKNQRDICSNCIDTVSCDNCGFFNTIPIRLSTCCSGVAVEAVVGVGGPSTSYFRVESICNDRYVKLRLLTTTEVGEEVVLTATNYTVVIDLECIGSIQCFEPINLTVTVA
jgi:hypothetical protein